MGYGYKALWRLIQDDHPTHQMFPHDSITATPRQKSGESLDSYHTRYLDFLDHRAFLTDNVNDLNNTYELDLFIFGTTHYEELRKLTSLERVSKDPEDKRKYKKEHVLKTLRAYEKMITGTVSNKTTPSARTIKKQPKRP